MSKIEDLKRSMSEKTDEELLEELRTIRLSRRTPKTKVGKKKKQAKTLTLDIKNLSVEQAQDFLKLLEAEGELDDIKGD